MSKDFEQKLAGTLLVNAIPAINANNADKPTEPTPIIAATFSESLSRPAANKIKPISGNNTVRYK